MNRSFNTVFNHHTNTWQAVPEHTRRSGKRGGAIVRQLISVALAVAVAPAMADVTIDNGDTVSVPGDHSSPWQVGGSLSVGYSGAGSLLIEEGGTVSNTWSSIGDSSSGVGNVTVRGADSSWVNGGWLSVGFSGTGRLLIEEGGTVSSARGYIGDYSSGVGEVTVSGARSSWVSSGSLDVGYYGTGSLLIEEGGTVSNTVGYIGYGSSGVGEVTVSGADSFWVNSGVLSVGYSGTGSLLVEAGGLVSSQSTLLTFFSNSTGTLTLTGNTTDGRGVLETGQLSKGMGTGTVTVDGGILRATGNQANYLANFGAGGITLQGEGLFFDTSTYNVGLDAAMLGGTGGLTKLGLGTLTLNSASPYTRDTHVEAGILEVNGDLDFSSGATYRVNVDDTGQHGQLHVTGTATLGGNVVALAANGNYQANTAYTILTSANAVQGQFGGVTSSLTFLDAALDYTDPNSVNLILSRNDIAYTDVAQTGNQRNLANALQQAASGGNTSADMGTVLSAVNNLSATQARDAFDSMSGAGLVALQRAATGFTQTLNNQLMSRLHTVGMGQTAQSRSGIQLAANSSFADLMPMLAQATMSDVPSSSSFRLGSGIPLDDNKHGFWLRGFGSNLDTDGDRNAHGSRIKGTGISAGVDRQVTDNLVVGTALSYSHADVRAGVENGKSRSSAAALYASYANGPWTVNGNLMLAHSNNDMDRRISVGSLQRKATADFDSKTISAYGEISYDLPVASWTLQHVAGLALTYNRNDSFTEKGAGALNIDADAQSSTSTRTLLGTRALFDINGISVQPRAIWAHEFGDVNKGMTAQLQGAPAASFKTYGVDLPRDSLITGVTVAGKTQAGLSLFADVQGEFNSKQTNLALLIGVRKSW